MRIATALFLGSFACSGGEPTAPPAPAPAPAAAPVAPVPPPPAPVVDAFPKDKDITAFSEDERKAFLMGLGEKVYKTGDGGVACLTCHGEEGKGTPGAFPPLVGQKDLMGDCKKHATYVLKGLMGEITVDGQKYNGVMVPQADYLNDLQIAAVTSYERNSWGNSFGFCSPDDVKVARATP